MNAEDLCFMSVGELSALLKSKEISPVDLVEAQLSRIEELDGVLRAFIYVDAENARAQARAAEAEIAAGSYRGPLHGLTVAHKDIIDVAGLPTTAASKIMSEYVATTDATVTAKLRAAGAICLGKLNLIEFASGSMGLYGYARNPHNLAASPGGSSSGSGTALAAGLVTIATGTDTGGSVRNPANNCGLVGLRPTYGRVSRYGVVPLGWSQDAVGPMGRTVADVATMLGEMAGPDRNDSTAAVDPVPDYTVALDKDIKGLRIGLPRTLFFEDIDSQIDAALKLAVKQFEDLGAIIVPVHLPLSEYASSASWTIAYSEAFRVHRKWFEQRAHDYTPAFYHKIAAAGMTSAEDYITSQQIRQLVTREWLEVMQQVDIVLLPSSRTLASTEQRGANGQRLRWGAEMASPTRPSSLTGFPAMSVPAGFADDNVPIGMQLVAAPFQEATLFRAALAFENVTSHTSHRPPPFPDDIPPPPGSLPRPEVRMESSPIDADWVARAAQMLGYDFVRQEDLVPIAQQLAPVKRQLDAARQELDLKVEPYTRPAGMI